MANELKPVLHCCAPALALALVLAGGARLRAGAQDDSSVVQLEKSVVVGAKADDSSAGPARAVMDAAGPLADFSWENLAAQVANLRVEAGGPGSFGAIYTIRGLANTPYFSDPAVTLYFDDIPLASSFTYPSDLFGFASAAVFRGPEPTQFGRSGDGGVIVLALPPPAQRAGGELRAGIGDYGALSAAVQAGGAEGDRADVSVAAAYSRREGYIENTEIGRRVDDLRAATAFARQRFRPTAESELSLEILADRHRDGAQPLVPLGGPLYTVARSREGETDTDMLGAALKGVFETGAGHLSTVTSYTVWKLDPYDDWLVLPPPLDSHLTQSQEAWNEELHLSGSPGEAVSWSLGAWLSAGETTGAVERTISGVIPFDESEYHYTSRDGALFGEAVFRASPSWRISVGARAERASKDYRQVEQVPTPGLGFHFTRSDGFFLPKVDVALDIGPGTTADAGVTFGSRPGGFAAYTFNPSLIPFAAEHTGALEAGLKSSLAGNSLVLAARAFAYSITNYQIERSFSPADYFVATAPRARSLGAELQVSWRPSPAWTVEAAAGFADVTLLEFRDPLTGASYSGDRAPYAPAFTAGLSVAYRSAAGWFAAGGAAATGRTFYTEQEDPTYTQAAYAVVNARAGFDSRRWRITLYIDNAGDRGYYSLIVPGVKSAAPGAPRTLGSELAVKF